LTVIAFTSAPSRTLLQPFNDDAIARLQAFENHHVST
jgi:hypothetical protein